MDSEKSVQKIQDDSHSFWRRGYGLLESWTLGSSYDIYPYIGDSGIITTAMGVTGIYIGKIYVEVKQRPRYFVQERA